MKRVFIKYNPYKLETEITVDGKCLKESISLRERIIEHSRLQEWVEDLPQILIDEYNDLDFEVTFHGTLLDYEDLTTAFKEAEGKNKLKASLDHKPAKETKDKELLIEGIFHEIQKGPFDEFKDAEIVNAFEHAKNSDFEVCVVATMSAGKSTLINAMLRTKLMPSKMEACTAIITRIKDCRREVFKAQVYTQENSLSESYENLTYTIMERLNSDENVSRIEVSGNIPFVSSEDVSLVLIDTPGPDNARDKRHQKVQSEFLGKSSKPLILYIMTGEFGTNDDNDLLNSVAERMSVGGKQSKDRFIFVVNKLDDRKPEDGDLNQTLTSVRSYLRNHGIEKPNLFPVAALPALDIRLKQKLRENIDKQTLKRADRAIEDFNDNDTGVDLHFEKQAPLPPSIRKKIDDQLVSAQKKWSGESSENPDEALIHTGVVSLEAAIQQYVQKYAKTAKIRNIADTLIHKLKDEKEQEGIKKALSEIVKDDTVKAREDLRKVQDQLNSIKSKIYNAQEALDFKVKVNYEVESVNHRSQDAINVIIEEFQSRIAEHIKDSVNKDISIEDVNKNVDSLKAFAKKLEPNFKKKLDELIRDKLVETSKALVEAYKKKLSSLNDEIDVKNFAGIIIDPLKLMSGSFEAADFDHNDFIKMKEVEDGKEWVENSDKEWYKPWTWFDEEGDYRAKYKSVKYVSGSTLAQEFLFPLQQNLYDNGDAACKYALMQSAKIGERFMNEFARLDGILVAKYSEFNSCTIDKEKAAARVSESEKKLEWLNHMKAEVNSILEI